MNEAAFAIWGVFTVTALLMGTVDGVDLIHEAPRSVLVLIVGWFSCFPLYLLLS